ncbi:MAG: VTT domain-containing protein [Polyangiaceae bacterium]|nr:VTT domain-containing protein [Polyangiaceae bacterium]
MSEPAFPKTTKASRLPPAPALLLFAIIGITGAACLLALWRGWVSPELIQTLVRQSGPGAMAVYVGSVVVLELLWMPRVWGLIASGVLFGPFVGFALSVVADLMSAVIGYSLARGTARVWVRTLLEKRPKARRLVMILAEKKGITTIAILRMMPIAHYTLCNYVAGVAGVRPGPFLVGTVIGLIPAAVLYAFLGDSLLRPGSGKFLVMVSLIAISVVLSLIVGRRMLTEPGAGTGTDTDTDTDTGAGAGTGTGAGADADTRTRTRTRSDTVG